MKPRMVILNKQEYFEKFDQALAYSLEGQHEQCLNLLIELKEKRWINFSLFSKIAEEYEILQKFDEANNILKQTKPESEDDQKQLIKSKQRIQQKLAKKQETDKLGLFKETMELLLYAQEIQQGYDLIRNIKNFPSCMRELINKFINKSIGCPTQAYYCFGYFQTNYFIQQQFLEHGVLPKTEAIKANILIGLLCFDQYQRTLDLLNLRQDDYIKFFLQGFCNQQMKHYQLAIICYKKSFQLRNTHITALRIKSLQNQIGASFQIQLINDEDSNEINEYVKFYKFSKQILVNKLRDLYDVKNDFFFFLQFENNTQMFLYHELFQLKYLSDKQHPILQQICDHLIKYAPRYAAGYANQYVLFIDQQRFQEAYQLAGPLFECEDSTLKFITLAKIYLVQYRNTVSSNDFNTQAHLVLEQAKELNQYEEDIYILKREVYYAEKNYQEVRQTERFLVKLEKENYLFICQLIAPMINKFEYYRAFDLLQFGDEENARLNELKLLMQIISKPANQDREQIIKSLDEIESTSKFTFFGHYWLSQGDINLAKESYQESILQQIQMGQLDMIRFYTQAIEFISNNQQQLNQDKILNIIWQISVYTYEPIEQEKYFHKRFVDTLGFVLVSFIFSQSLQQICQFINSKYDVEVPHLKDFKSVLFKSVYAIYCLDHISIDQYSGYIETGIKQLQKLLISPEQSMELFYQFCSVKKNEIVNLMNFENNQPAKVNLILKEIYSISFFYDPVSKIALLTAIKMIGYFVDNDLANNYQNMEEWLGAYMLKLNVEAYYRTIIKQRHLD